MTLENAKRIIVLSVLSRTLRQRLIVVLLQAFTGSPELFRLVQPELFFIPRQFCLLVVQGLMGFFLLYRQPVQQKPV